MGFSIEPKFSPMKLPKKGFINLDIQMCPTVPHIFAMGDIVGQPMLAHQAVHQAHVAAEIAHGSCTDVPRALTLTCISDCPACGLTTRRASRPR